jgi:hypothetical protein
VETELDLSDHSDRIRVEIEGSTKAIRGGVNRSQSKFLDRT